MKLVLSSFLAGLWCFPAVGAIPESPVLQDWILQDAGVGLDAWLDEKRTNDLEKKMVAAVLDELGAAGDSLRAEAKRFSQMGSPPRDPRWLDLYFKACRQRREIRLRPLLAKCRTIIFLKHYDIGGSHYAYTEGVSDALGERHFRPGSSLCLLELNGIDARVRDLINDPNGVIRDPDISWDGKRILFAWKKSDRKDDYHLYEMDVDSGRIRQLTLGLGFADYEASYLPGGGIVFNSTRCGQAVDCSSPEVSNLYTCDADGRYLRRLSFDQVHTNFPTVTSDGRVLYTRWDYNDRGQVFPQPLFQMNPDGTCQAQVYGNNSWFPTSILHARGIPGSHKILGILSGHHSRQRGKLARIDPSIGTEEGVGITLLAPERPAEPVRIDAYGQSGEQFQYPYPLSETEFLITYRPDSPHHPRFAVYFMMADGRRELLASDPTISCSQPTPLVPRKRPPLRPTPVDYRTDAATYYMQDVYAGPGLAGMPRGTIRSIRVVALDFRAASIRANMSRGPGGAGHSQTPVSIGRGTWDVKVVLGTARVYSDGSAYFQVPARTPLYFQALDSKGHAVQTMRSWNTLQPGEVRGCVGCHEPMSGTPVARGAMTQALRVGPQKLEPFYGPPRGFSFIREIQPILDRHCIRCHSDRTQRPDFLNSEASKGRDAPMDPSDKTTLAFSLLGEQTVEERSGRKWSDSYLALTQPTLTSGYLMGRSSSLVNWIGAQSVPPMLPPYFAGAAKSGLITQLEKGHRGVKLSQEEIDKIACWIDLLVPYCGDYTEANAWTPAEVKRYAYYLEKRKRMEVIEEQNLTRLLQAEAPFSDPFLFRRLSASPWQPQLLPGVNHFVFTLYGTPGDLTQLKELVAVMKEKGLGNGFDPGPAARAPSRPLFEYLAEVGWPIICYPGYSDMQVKHGRCRLGDEDEKALEPLDSAGVFSAIQLGEWGYHFHNLSHVESWWRAVYGDEFEKYKHLMMPAGLAGYERRPQTRRDCYEQVKDYFLARNRYMRGRNMSVTGHSHYEAYAAEWGAHVIGLELGENIAFTQSKIAFARGASRQWKKPWSIQVSPWFSGSCTTRGPLRMEGRYARGLGAGHSLNFYERMWLHAWFAGTAMVTPENSISIFFEDARAPWKLTAHAEKARDVFRFMQTHDRGIPFTPVAIVLDRYVGYNGYRGRPWGILENTPGDVETRDLFQHQLFPGSDHIHVKADPDNPEKSYLRATPFGEAFDVLLSHARGELLGQYDVLLLVGDMDFDSAFTTELHQAVRQGSRLLLHSRHAKALGEELKRLQDAGHVEVLDPWTNPATGRAAAISHQRLTKLLSRHMPIGVDGDPVQYQINRNRAGWVVELINNAGIIKKPTEPVKIDSTARILVTLRARFPVASVRSWRRGQEVSPTQELKVSLEAGETEYIEWVPKR